MKKMSQKIYSFVEESVQKNGAQYTAFGLFVFFTYPTWYFFWINFSVQPYSNLLLRIIAAGLCLILALNKYWPPKIKKYLPIYWYLTLTYCLPFFFTFMTIKNLYSPIWVTNCMLALYFLMLLVDFKSFIILFFIGTCVGILTAYFPYPPNLEGIHVDYFGISITFLVSLVIGGMFAHNREKMEQTKLEIVRSLGASIAHELRTPLLAIQMGVSGTKEYFPSLIKAYKIAKANNLEIDPIQSRHLQILNDVFDIIESEVTYSHTIINMILMNVKQDIASVSDFKSYSMHECVEEALVRYPFKTGERDLVSFINADDFKFYGDKTLMVHVLFNLLKNSLYYIQAARKGEIHIWLDKNSNENVLYFKDTGQGIPDEILKNLFEKFYTTTYHGTGLGLAFCKMVLVSFGGSVSCTSKYGEFTQFKMTFPVNKNED